MKSFILKGNIIILFASLLIISSCSKDDAASPSNTNSIKFEGKAFDVSQAAILGVSIGGEGHVAITFNNGDQSSMKTLTIDIEYFSEQSIEGEYAFPEIEGKRLLNDWLTNYSEYDGITNTSIHLQEGTLNIVHNGGNNYTINMNLAMDGEKVFSGTYTGDFQVFYNNG